MDTVGSGLKEPVPYTVSRSGAYRFLFDPSFVRCQHRPRSETTHREAHETTQLFGNGCRRDGQLITIWRRARRYSGGFPNSNRGPNIEFELKYEPLGIYWKGDWSRHPMSFDIIDGVPYLVLFISDKDLCINRPKTDYSAQFLRWHHGRWFDVSQIDFPVYRALINLSVSFWGRTTADDYKELIVWRKKELPGGFNDRSPDTVKIYFERGSLFCNRFIN